MIVLVWTIYLISALLDLLENFWIVNRWPDERPNIYTPLNQSILYIGRILLFICSLIGIWSFYNFLITIIAFVIHMILGLISSKYYHDKKLVELINYYTEIYKEAFKNDADMTERKIISLSEKEAMERIIKNMKGLN